MTIFYFVRHGKTDYSEKNTRIYRNFGTQLAPLAETGVEQIRETAKDPRLQRAQVILSSPYTRAVQTAAVLAETVRAPILIETDLHEWLADKTYRYLPDEQAEAAFREYMENGGVYPDGIPKNWEDRDAIRRRVLPVLEQYRRYSKVIIAGHGMMIQALCGGDILPNGGIGEYRME